MSDSVDLTKIHERVCESHPQSRICFGSLMWAELYMKYVNSMPYDKRTFSYFSMCLFISTFQGRYFEIRNGIDEQYLFEIIEPNDLIE